MMEVLSRSASGTNLIHSQSIDFSRSANLSFDAQDGNIIWDAEAQGVNKKLMRLAVDSRTSTKRSSYLYDDSSPTPKNKSIIMKTNDKRDSNTPVTSLKVTQLNDLENTRFPRLEQMSHFHYTSVDFGGEIVVTLRLDENEDISDLDTGQGLLVQVNNNDKTWIVKRSQEDFVGLDRQIHRCLYDRRYSQLPMLEDFESGTKLTDDMVQQIQFYLSRFSNVAGNSVNCGPILNWLELDNHGNHLVVMEADDSAINVPAVAAGRVIKRYKAQAADEMTLEVGDFLSVIDMPPVEETIWWRGKKGFEVGFFPSHCVQIIGDKEINESILAHLQSRPISKRRGKFISFLRFFFKSRPGKDDLLQSGILRERVFGCDLGERLAFSGRDMPIVLELCSKVIEEHGIVDGIYRLSGIMSNLQSLRMAFNSDSEPPNLRDTKYLHDIHCISSLLKTYFRELPNPLFTYELYDKFVSAIGKDDDTEKTVAFHHVIQRLPPPHYRTMKYLLRHLNFCASKADETNMTAKNLAIVWAPNLLRPNVEDSVSALTEFRTQAIIVEYMIRNVDVFFNKNLASAAIAYYPEVQEVADESSIPRAATFSVGAPKLISLEEARQRISNHRTVSETVSLNSNMSNSPRHKLRSSHQPPKVAAAPISPLPTLLSIEEAQARTKTKSILPRRGSADFVAVNNLKNVINSPKRSKKWFGLFTRTKSGSVAEDESISKPNSVSTYRKVVSPKNGTPKRSQSEYRLTDIKRQPDMGLGPRTSSFGTAVIDRTRLSSSDESDLNIMMKKGDGDDTSLMSAIVSVTAKYINLESPRKKSFTIGEPQEFRRLDDAELKVVPPKNVIIRQDPLLLEQPKNIASSHLEQSQQQPSAPAAKQYKNRLFELEIDSDGASNSPREKNGDMTNKNSPERKHQLSMTSPRRDLDDNVPMKKVRSLSPECYVKPDSNIYEYRKSDTIGYVPWESKNVISKSPVAENNLDKVFISPAKQKTCSPTSGSSFIGIATRKVEASDPSELHLDFTTDPTDKQATSTVGTPLSGALSVQTNKVNETKQTVFTSEKSSTMLSRQKPHSQSLYSRPTRYSVDNAPMTYQKFAFRRMRSHSQEDCALDSLVQRTERQINHGSAQSVVPKRDYETRVTSPDNTPYNKTSTHERTDSRYDSAKSVGYMSKQHIQEQTNFTQASVSPGNNRSRLTHEKSFEHTPRYQDTKSEILSNAVIPSFESKHSGDSYLQQRLTPPDSTAGMTRSSKSSQKKEGAFTNIHDRPNALSRKSERTRSRSVKERAALFNSPSSTDVTYTSSHSDLLSISGPPASDRFAKTRSSPNLHSRLDPSASKRGMNNSPQNSTNSSRANVHYRPSNRHSSYIPDRTNSSEAMENNFHKPSSPMQTKTFKNDAHVSHEPAADRLVVSSYIRGNNVSNTRKERPRSEYIAAVRPEVEYSPQTREFLALNTRHASRPQSLNLSSTDLRSRHASDHSLSTLKSPSNLSIVKKSMSEHRISGDHDPMQLSSFPLASKGGNAQNNRSNISSSRRSPRPLSMYDNNRGSYYDNVHYV